MRHCLILGLVYLMAGCSSGDGRLALVSGLVGQNETVVVQTLGVPSRSFETGGARYLAYDEQRPTEIYGGGGFGVGSGFYGAGIGGFAGGFGGGFGGFPAQVVAYHCETTFEVRNERVTGFQRRGNAC